MSVSLRLVDFVLYISGGQLKVLGKVLEGIQFSVRSADSNFVGACENDITVATRPNVKCGLLCTVHDIGVKLLITINQQPIY